MILSPRLRGSSPFQVLSKLQSHEASSSFEYHSLVASHGTTNGSKTVPTILETGPIILLTGLKQSLLYYYRVQNSPYYTTNGLKQSLLYYYRVLNSHYYTTNAAKTVPTILQTCLKQSLLYYYRVLKSPYSTTNVSKTVPTILQTCLKQSLLMFTKSVNSNFRAF